MAKKVSTSTSSTSTPSKPTATTTTSPTPSSTSHSSTKSSSGLSSRSSPKEIALHVWDDYLQNNPTRTFLLDAFMAFLVVIGAIQFLYAVLFGNFPFNAFLSGFCAAVGQFVLTASLRLQTQERPPTPSASPPTAATAKSRTATKKVEGSDGGAGGGDDDVVDVRVSSERAFADFVFGSLILHGFCVNFIN